MDDDLIPLLHGASDSRRMLTEDDPLEGGLAIGEREIGVTGIGDEILRDLPLDPEVGEEVICFDQLLEVAVDLTDRENRGRCHAVSA